MLQLLQIHSYQVRIDTMVFHQLFVAALLHNPASVHDYDPVRPTDSGETMSDNH